MISVEFIFLLLVYSVYIFVFGIVWGFCILLQSQNGANPKDLISGFIYSLFWPLTIGKCVLDVITGKEQEKSQTEERRKIVNRMDLDTKEEEERFERIRQGIKKIKVNPVTDRN